MRESASKHSGPSSSPRIVQRSATNQSEERPTSSRHVNAQSLLQLQRQVGNQATLQLFRAHAGSRTEQPAQLKKYAEKPAEQPDNAAPPAQFARYRTQQPINGITMDVEVVVNGDKLEIRDRTQSPGRQIGALSGMLKFSFNDDGSLSLDEFEAQPGGVGLGTLLMYEFALMAVSSGIDTITVSNPAFSAMGAYKIFGGIPSRLMDNAQAFKMYYEAMMADNSIHTRFIKGEADAVAEHAVSKEMYFDPNIGPVGQGNIYRDAYGGHMAKHNNPDDIIRAAELMALSSNLMYESSALLAKTKGMYEKKWTAS